MESTPKLGNPAPVDAPQRRPRTLLEPHYRIAEAAKLLKVSRALMYTLLRGEFIVDFSRGGRRGIKLVPESTLQRICDRHRKRFQ